MARAGMAGRALTAALVAILAVATVPAARGAAFTCPPGVWVRPETPPGYRVVSGIDSMEFKEARLYFGDSEAVRTRNGYLIFDEMEDVELRCYYAGGSVIGLPISQPIRQCARIAWGLECE